MSEPIFEAGGLVVREVVGPINGDSDRARLAFQIDPAGATLDKFDVAELRSALTKWQNQHPRKVKA